MECRTCGVDLVDGADICTNCRQPTDGGRAQALAAIPTDVSVARKMDSDRNQPTVFSYKLGLPREASRFALDLNHSIEETRQKLRTEIETSATQVTEKIRAAERNVRAELLATRRDLTEARKSIEELRLSVQKVKDELALSVASVRSTADEAKAGSKTVTVVLTILGMLIALATTLGAFRTFMAHP